MCQDNKLTKTIKCPHCGAEYTPDEIFLPGELIGKSSRIVKDPLGKILYVEYKDDEEPTLVEKFTCEYCDKDFTVEASISFKVSTVEEALDFQNDTVSLLD